MSVPAMPFYLPLETLPESTQPNIKHQHTLVKDSITTTLTITKILYEAAKLPTLIAQKGKEHAEKQARVLALKPV